MRTSIGGSRIRVRLSNEMGSRPLQVGAAAIGITSGYASLVAGSSRPLTFNGRTAVTVAAGAPLLSDPVGLAVPAQSDLAVSLYLPASVIATTVHDAAFQTRYASAAGNHTAAAALPVAGARYSWPYLTEIAVAASGGAPAGTLVALGDSQTDGALSAGSANQRWTDHLARRLQLETPGVRVGVVNRGLSGNRLVRDVPATAGVRWLAILLGINDIVYVSSKGLAALPDELALGYTQLVARAHARGIQVLGATLLPFEGFVWYAPARERARQQVNNLIRNAGAFDAVLAFDAAVRDPAQPARMLAACDGGDHLHPNDAGFDAIARSVPLGLFAG